MDHDPCKKYPSVFSNAHSYIVLIKMSVMWMNCKHTIIFKSLQCVTYTNMTYFNVNFAFLFVFTTTTTSICSHYMCTCVRVHLAMLTTSADQTKTNSDIAWLRHDTLLYVIPAAASHWHIKAESSLLTPHAPYQ